MCAVVVKVSTPMCTFSCGSSCWGGGGEGGECAPYAEITPVYNLDAGN